MSAFATRLTALALTCATCIAIVLAMPQPAGAFTATESRPPLPAPLAGKGEGAWAKAGHELRRVVAAYREHERQGVAAEFKPDNPSVRVAKGLVLVDAVASGDGAALLADLQLLGLRDGSRYGQVVSGWIPLGRMDAVVALSSLRSVSASLAPERNAATYGLVADRSGAIAMSADGLAQNGLTGTGVTVGVLSDTYDYNVATPDTTAAEDQANGDLPDGSSAFNGADVFVMAEGGNRGYDEGRAMMQLIHDVAPDSSLVFHSAFNGLADFASGIEELAAGDPLKGIPPARVIVDDVLYFAEPMFQDGIAAQAVDKVVGQGVAYFSAAGNAARSSYQAAFVDSGETFWICSFFSGPNCATDPAHNGGEYRGRLRRFHAVHRHSGRAHCDPRPAVGPAVRFGLDARQGFGQRRRPLPARPEREHRRGVEQRQPERRPGRGHPVHR